MFYVCEDIENNYFCGFIVWRWEGSVNFVCDICIFGLDGSGYIKFFNVFIMDMENDRYVYIDIDVEWGWIYCYCILAEFVFIILIGSIIYNLVESFVLDFICVQFNWDILLIINVSVFIIDIGGGEMEVCWFKLVVEDLDILFNLGLYVYEVLCVEG